MANNFSPDWKPISTAPFGSDLELAVIEKNGAHGVHYLVVALSADGSLPEWWNGAPPPGFI